MIPSKYFGFPRDSKNFQYCPRINCGRILFLVEQDFELKIRGTFILLLRKLAFNFIFISLNLQIFLMI